MRKFLALVLFFVSGCSTQGRGNTTTGIDESQFNKTMVGALAGAAGGATVGVLASNDAATGIAIGAISGGIIGAGVGAILAKNDDENDTLSENSHQQSEKIKQQQRDIDYLRSRDAEKPSLKINDDGVGEENLPLIPPPASSRPGDISRSETPADISGIKPKLVKQEAGASLPPPAAISHEPSARGTMSNKYPYTDNRPSGSRSSRSINSEALSSASSTTSSAATTAAVATTAVAATAAATTVAAKSTTPTAVLPADTTKVAKEAAPKVETKAVDPVKPDIAPTLKKVTPEPVAPTSVMPPTGQAGCKEAVKEAEQGLKSSSDADRLFYLRRASRLCPSEATYHVELGRMLSSLGKSNEAKQELKHALTLDPKNQAAKEELSVVENSSGKK